MNDLQELFSAIENCDIEKISCLAKNGVDLNATNSTGCSPLLFAISKFCRKIAAIPLEEDFSKNQNSALVDIEKDAMLLISILLENGANVNYETQDGCTPFGLLKFNLYLVMLSFLPSAMDGGADEYKLAMKTISKIFKNLTSLLIQAGADENYVNKFNETPSQYAERIMTEEIEKRV